MAELSPIKLSDMELAAILGASDVLYVAVADAQSETGYYSRKTTTTELAQLFLNTLSFPLLLPNTTAKNVIGAINELKGTEMTSTLLAGQTTVTFLSADITTASTIDIYTDKFGVSPENVTVTNGQVTIVFEAQSSDLGVKVVIK